MLIQHSASVIVHRQALKDADGAGNALAMVARARGDILQSLALDPISGPDSEVRAAQSLVDKKA